MEIKIFIRAHFFQARDSNGQQLCQEGKLKMNNSVCVSFIRGFKGSWEGARAMGGSIKLHAIITFS